jgi:hypothetical protein
MRARKELLRSCSLLKETIFRRGLDAEPPVSAISFIGTSLPGDAMVFLLTTESVCARL